MKLALTPTQSRLLALALLVLTVTILTAAVAWPVWRLHQHYDQFLDESTDHLARYRRVAGMRPAIETAIAAVEKRDSRKYYLKAVTPTLAAAELQGLATKIIETRQGRIVSSQIIPGKEDGKAAGPTKITLSIQLNASIVPLQLILHALETNEPYFFVDQLTVRANQGRNFKPIPGAQPEFVVQLTISAYMAKGATKP